MIKKIISPTNPIIQHVVKLHQAKYRAKFQEFIAEGIRTIATLIKAGHQPKLLFVVEHHLDEIKKIVPEETIILTYPSVMQKISTYKSTNGIVAIFDIPQQQPYHIISSGIVMVEIQDPGNAGTLIRTAVAMNKKTAIFIDSVDAWSPKVVQATAGAIGMISIFCMKWDQLLEHKGDKNLCALILSQKNNPRSIDLANALIVVGNEGHGLDKQKIGQCEHKMTLAMPGNFESLNASIAGSIALYLSTLPITTKGL